MELLLLFVDLEAGARCFSVQVNSGSNIQPESGFNILKTGSTFMLAGGISQKLCDVNNNIQCWWCWLLFVGTYWSPGNVVHVVILKMYNLRTHDTG